MIKPEIKTLIEISHFYGNNSNYVIAGGGNTSYKNKDFLWIKASGTSLSDISEEGLVCLSRKSLQLIYEKKYSDDNKTREEQVKKDLNAAIESSKNKRPSVETTLHDCIDYAFIVHTHPTLVNAVLCSNNVKETVERLFGDTALYIEYIDPGYILFKHVYTKIEAYKTLHYPTPKIIFLQNHGVFVASNSVDEIISIYDAIQEKISKEIQINLPDISSIPNNLKELVTRIENQTGKCALPANSKLIQYFCSDLAAYTKISKPFTPDGIVYCKSKYLFIEDENKVDSAINDFESNNGYLPKIIIILQKGLIALDDSEKKAQTVLHTFEDTMKISYLSENFGGQNFMTDKQIQFIDTWEVENYRRMMNS